MIDLFQTGTFTLSSGIISDFLIDCDALSDNSIDAISVQIAKRMPLGFGSVEGIPRGGIRLANHLRKYINPNSTIHLICDDVLTTGGSMKRAKDKWLSADPKRYVYDVKGVVLFARGMVYPRWIKPLFQMTDLV